MAQQMYGTFDSVDVAFDQNGALVDPASVTAVKSLIASKGATDLFVISHGWNNNIPEAQDLYERFFTHVHAQLATNPNGLNGRVFAVLAVLWPSKRFTDTSTIPGGAAGADDVRADQIRASLDNLADAFPGAAKSLQLAKALVDSLEDSEAAQDRFVQILAGVMAPPQQPDAGMDDLHGALAARSGSAVLQDIKGTSVGPAPTPPAQDFDGGGAADMDDAGAPPSDAGGAASLGSFFATIKDAALGLCNVTTYYTMKERAGTIGRVGLNPVLHALAQAAPNLKIHLVGHSFGCRLVTAAAAGDIAVPIATLALLQAAYSHYGFSNDYDGKGDAGFFRDVVAKHKVHGPIVITHTVQDVAVGLAYPIASRIANQQANALGDANDPFGGMGRNGAQKTPEVPNMNALLLPAGGNYTLVNGVPNNLNGDTIITGHGDIARDETAFVVLRAVAAT